MATRGGQGERARRIMLVVATLPQEPPDPLDEEFARLLDNPEIVARLEAAMKETPSRDSHDLAREIVGLPPRDQE